MTTSLPLKASSGIVVTLAGIFIIAPFIFRLANAFEPMLVTPLGIIYWSAFVAVKASAGTALSPAGSVSLFGVRTVTVQVAVLPLADLAVIVAVPLLTPVTVPYTESTVATPVLFELNVTS